MFEGGRNDIEKAIELLKTINQNMKVDHMTKDMWDGTTEEETREYIENFGLINIAISALEKQMPKKGGRRMRLIDAGAIKTVDYSGLAYILPSDYEGIADYFYKQLVLNQPTAYDVDKVIVNLMNSTYIDEEKCYFIPEEAIEIVKRGGQE